LTVFLNDDVLKKLVKRGAAMVEGEGFQILFLGSYSFLLTKDFVVPTLASNNRELLDKLPSVWIDKGAVQRVSAGADVMRPGITKMDSFTKNSVVAVRDDSHSVILAVGVALMGADEAEKASHGKVVKNLHHVDDRVWKML